MKNSRIKINGLLLFCFFLLIITCVNRDTDRYPRSNPYDPGGDNFINNQGPDKITVLTDSIKWHNFNYYVSKGTIKLPYCAYDPNGEYDTLSYFVQAGSNPDSLDSIYSGRCAYVLIDDIAPSQKVFFKITATDLFNSSCSVTGSFMAPSGLPPNAPDVTLNSISSYSKYIKLLIDTVFNTSGYRIYRADTLNGSYTLLKDTIPYSPYNSYLYYTDRLSDYIFHYYVVASYNEYGESRSYPPVEARLYNSGLSTPSIYSVSMGTYKDSIKVSWYPTSSSSVAYYLLFRKESYSGYYKIVANIPKPGSTSLFSFYDTLYTGDTCYYTLAAYNSYNHGSNISSAKYGHFSRMTYPASFTASQGTYTTHVSLTWSFLNGAQSYNIYRAAGPNGIYAKIKTTSSLSYNDSVTTNNYYYYRISANDSIGLEGAKSAPKAGYLTRLSAPSGVSASDGTSSFYIIITWNNVANAKQYNIYRSTSYSGTYSIIDSTDTTIYRDSGITGTSYYYYKVSGVDGAGKEGDISSYNSGYLKSFSAPANVQVSKYMYGTYIAVTWDREKTATGYNVYKSTSSSSSSFVKIATVSDTGYNDTSVSIDTRYYYKISSLIGTQETSLSSYVYGYLLNYPQSFRATGYSGYIIVYWTSNSNVAGYYIYRSSDDSTFTRVAVISSPGASSYRDSLYVYRDYYYKISAYSTEDASKQSPSVLCRMLPVIPDSLRAEENADHVKLIWNNSPGADYYEISRSTSSSGTTVIDTAIDTTYNDSLATATKYYYKVRAVGQGGYSNYSMWVYAGISFMKAILQ